MSRMLAEESVRLLLPRALAGSYHRVESTSGTKRACEESSYDPESPQRA